jgi:C1A family cysteine protease
MSEIKKIIPRRKYGWKKGKRDALDVKYTIDSKTSLSLAPTKIDLRLNCPPIYDQGNLGSCTANALAFAYQFDELKQNTKSKFIPSRLFTYYDERVIEGTVPFDSGAEIRDGIKSINTTGVCEESLWPYDTSKFTVKPLPICFTNATKCKSVLYHYVEQNIVALKTPLLSGYPIVFGFNVFESFESDALTTTGIMHMPAKAEQVIGGHAVAIVGYDDDFVIDGVKGAFIIRNSWGALWGLKGYFYMPYNFILTGNASDFWVVQQVSNVACATVDTKPTGCSCILL